MPLRTRLLLALIGVGVASLVISDVVTYTQLQSYLQNRIDPPTHVDVFGPST